MHRTNLFQQYELILNNELATYFQTNSNQADAHFFGGNGLPMGVYLPFLTLLSKEFRISSLAFRASWKNAPKQTRQVKWSIYTNDLINFIETTYAQPIIGIGHSQGANATLMAASQRPDLFKALYLFDPVCVTKFDQIKSSLIPYFIKKRFEPFKSSLRKKSIWKSPEAYFQYLQKAKGYKRISEQNLKLLARESLILDNNGRYKLIFPRDWETANYALPINFDKALRNLSLPYKIILGKPSLFVSPKVRANWNKFAKKNIIINSNYGHLIPLEAPTFCAEQLLNNYQQQLSLK